MRGSVRGCVVLVALTASPAALAGTPTSFPSGSVVVPMDSSLQDRGILEAYGMVYEMLRRGIPVSWVIDGDKVPGGDDLPPVATYLTTETSAAASPRAFRGGPWVIDASHAAAAQTVVAEWRAAGHVSVAYVATEAFTGEVSRRLFAAPSIVIYEDGHEDIAWGYLNAAGIPDLAGAAWDADSAYNLSDAELVGPSPTVAGDGALFDDDGVVNYCHLNAMHYAVTDAAPVSIEFRRFAEDPLVSFLTECEASASLENDPTGGHMLSDGIAKVGVNAGDAVVAIEHPSDELVQIDGPWDVVGGSLPDFTGTFHSDVRFITADDGNRTAKLLAYGHLDGDPARGKVTFLGGHAYKTDLPYTTHPEINGVRVFLNSYFTARCTELADAPVVTVLGDPVATGNDVTVDLDWANAGTGRGRDGTLTLQLPANLTYVGDDAGGVYDPSTRTVTWDLDTLASGESGHITLTLVAAVDAVDTLDATLRYRVEATWFEVDWTGTVAHGPDTDGDGLLDVEETPLGTDPSKADTDGDGLDDGVEVDLGADPMDADTDDDGLADGEEVTIGTSPVLADTDSDGITDGVEVGIGTDPLLEDTDGDGLDDHTEITDTATDPLVDDTDADGLLDGAEVTLGTDPLDPDTDADGSNDGAEVTDGTDPFDVDSDDDGLQDGAEADHLTDPLDPDSDDDGLTDGAEVNETASDPLDSDSDDDGLSDGTEVDDTATNPNVADTDGGGVADGAEVNAGLDPLDPADDLQDSDGDGSTDADEVAAGTDPLDPEDGGLKHGVCGCSTGSSPGGALVGLLALWLARRRGR